MKARTRAVAISTAIACASIVIADAHAADLGGNCCADLEERIAELEATTARKGNRKVSLSVTGWVAEQLMWYDNGAESNVYQTSIGSTLASHFKLTGSASINADWSAGYVIQVETNSSDPLTAGNTAFSDDGPSAYHITNTNGGFSSPSIDVLYSFWFLNSKSLGKVSVGLIPQASEHAAVLVDGSGSLVPANWVPLNGTAIDLALNGVTFPLAGVTGSPASLPIGALQWCNSTSLPVAGDCNAIPNSGVRYDSPTFGGFSVSASWGEDDFWDVAAKYAGEFNGIKLAAVIAYSQNNDESNLTGFNTVFGLLNPIKRDSSYLQAGAFVMHAPSGLFVYGAYGKENNDNVYALPAVTAGEKDGSNWYLKAGLRRKWVSLGNTVLYGTYGQRNDMFTPTLALVGVTGSEVTQYGLGVVQEIDAAAMALWINWNHSDAEITGLNILGNAGLSKVDFDSLDTITFGGLISF